MQRRTRLSLVAFTALSSLTLAASLGSAPDSRGMKLGAAAVQSLGAMAFGPDGTLFVADPSGGTLVALDVADRSSASFGERLQARDLDQKVAALLGTTRERIRFNDMAVHPTTKAIYLTVSRVDGDAIQPALVRVTGPEAVELVNLDNIKFASTPIPEAPAKDAKTPWGQPQWRLAVTDLSFVDGELFVAGLSNEQFASALRRVPFPFNQKAAVSTVEIYHTSHDKWETASPIEAFVPITIDGVPMILAGYGCSPIATFKRADLTGTHHVKGRTVAELGGGNRPIDIIRYTTEGKEMILIANSHRTLMRIDPADIGRAAEMTKPVSRAYEAGGVSYLSVSSAGVMQLDNYDANAVVVLQRDIDSGGVQLSGYSKKWL